MSTDLEPDDRMMVARAKQLLDRSEADLDPAIVLRLQRARTGAREARPRSRWRPVWTAGFAMAALAAIAVLLWTKQPAPEPHRASSLEDWDLALSAENVELADDLEFYHWLADVDTTG